MDSLTDVQTTFTVVVNQRPWWMRLLGALAGSLLIAQGIVGWIYACEDHKTHLVGTVDPNSIAPAISFQDGFLYTFFIFMGCVCCCIELITSCTSVLKYFFFYHTPLGKASFLLLIAIIGFGLQTTFFFWMNGCLMGVAFAFYVIFVLEMFSDQADTIPLTAPSKRASQHDPTNQTRKEEPTPPQNPFGV